MNDEDIAWFETLAGRRPTNGSQDAEARLLHDAIRATPVDLPARLTEQEVDMLAARVARRPTAARRRGWCEGCADRWRRGWRAGSWVLGAAATLGLLAVVLPWSEPTDPFAMRGEPSVSMQQRVVEDARLARDQLADALAAMGVTVRRYDRLGRFGLDAEPQGAWPDEARLAVAAKGLALPKPGAPLQVEFLDRSP